MKCRPTADEPATSRVPGALLLASEVIGIFHTPTNNMAFDFNQFNGGDSKRPFSSLGLTAEQVQEIMSEEYGLSQTLMQEFPDITKRADKEVGSVPLAFVKAGILFEAQQRDTTFDAIGAQLGVTDDTAAIHAQVPRRGAEDIRHRDRGSRRERPRGERANRTDAATVIDVMKLVRPAMKAGCLQPFPGSTEHPAAAASQGSGNAGSQPDRGRSHAWVTIYSPA